MEFSVCKDCYDHIEHILSEDMADKWVSITAALVQTQGMGRFILNAKTHEIIWQFEQMRLLVTCEASQKRETYFIRLRGLHELEGEPLICINPKEHLSEREFAILKKDKSI
jgi:hypothetical protein